MQQREKRFYDLIKRKCRLLRARHTNILLGCDRKFDFNLRFLSQHKRVFDVLLIIYIFSLSNHKIASLSVTLGLWTYICLLCLFHLFQIILHATVYNRDFSFMLNFSALYTVQKFKFIYLQFKE